MQPLVSEPFAQAVIATYREICKAICNHGNSKLGEMESASEKDRQAMLSWNPRDPFTSMEYSCMHLLVEAKCREIPTADAVYAWDGSITNAELDRIANVSAQCLAQADVGPGVCVPFAYEKSIWAVVATLAILKAGGALVPVNSNDPITRLV